jgi:hypothetical protein
MDSNLDFWILPSQLARLDANSRGHCQKDPADATEKHAI